MSLTANLEARLAFTAALLAALAPSTEITKKDCMEIGVRVLLERGEDDFEAVKARFGIPTRGSVNDLMPEMFKEFWHHCYICLVRGISPTYAWSAMNSTLPNHLRDRWLLWHDESDCLWEVRGKLSGSDLDGLSSGEVVDVSGVEKFEQMFVQRQTLAEIEEL